MTRMTGLDCAVMCMGTIGYVVLPTGVSTDVSRDIV